MRELFGSYLEGSEACVVLAMSARRLGGAAWGAIEKSLAALGYGDDACTFATLAPQGAMGLDSAGAESGVQLDAQALFMLVEELDPVCVICADAATAEALGDAYRTAFALDAPARVFGRPGVMFRDFAALMTTDDGKQRAWKLLKSLPKR